jgi:hypothetical protein
VFDNADESTIKEGRDASQVDIEANKRNTNPTSNCGGDFSMMLFTQDDSIVIKDNSGLPSCVIYTCDFLEK